MVLQAELVAQNARYDGRRVLTVARPDEPVRLVLQICSMMIGYLLARVPQHYDGLRAWRATRNPQSWQAAAREATVESFRHALCNHGQSNRCH
jgi:hypothetical protein